MRVTFQTNEQDERAAAFREGKEAAAKTWKVYRFFAESLRLAPVGLTFCEITKVMWSTTSPKLDILTLMTGLEELVEWEFIKVVVYGDDGKVIPTDLDGQPIEAGHVFLDPTRTKAVPKGDREI